MFHLVSEDDIESFVKKSPTKSSCVDPMPTSVIKLCLDKLLTILTWIINLSLKSGVVTQSLKSAVVTPLLKKASLDTEILKNFRPISNLPFASKILEKVVASQLNEYFNQNALLEPLQSAYRKLHSTETALLSVHNSITRSLDSGNVVLLVLLDLSAAFDTIDHSILLQRLSNLGIKGVALQWIRSYLTGRFQSVSVKGSTSSSKLLNFGVPQGSVLGPLLFSIYISPLGNLIRHLNLNFHQYADDNQLYLSFTKSNTASAISSIQSGVLQIKEWMTQNKLKFNDSKTEVLYIHSKFDRSPMPFNSINIGSCSVTPAKQARNIGVTFDDTFSFHQHVSSTCRSIYFFLRKIGHIRKYLTNESCSTIVHAIVSSKLDYGNSLLYGIPDTHLHLLQRAQNTAARIITRTKKFDHITPALKQLHWLPISSRIEFKILLLTYKALNGLAPQYLADLVHYRRTCRNLRSNNKLLLEVPRWKLATYGRRCFSSAAPVLWNSLPLDIKSSPNVNIFKKKLKTHLFSKAYSA